VIYGVAVPESRSRVPAPAGASARWVPSLKVAALVRRVVLPTLPELAAGVVLLSLALAELLTGSPTPSPAPGSTPFHVIVTTVVCLSLGWLRVAPAAAAGAWSVALLVETWVIGPVQLLGTGFAAVAIWFGVGAFARRRSLPVLLVVFLVTLTVRDTAGPDSDVGDGIVDLVLTAAAFGVGLLVHSRTRQARDMHRERDEALQRNAEAVLAERARIARELHDIVAHSVSVMVVQAGTSRPLAQRTEPRLDETLRTIEETGREALLELRHLLDVLGQDSSSAHEPTPGAAQIPALVERMRSSGQHVELEVHGRLEQLGPGPGLVAYRTVQEGLTNALRHAPGAPVLVRLDGRGDGWLIEVRDGGPALPDTAPLGVPGAGRGLSGLTERVAVHGGRLAFGPEGGEFALKVWLPLEQVAP